VDDKNQNGRLAFSVDATAIVLNTRKTVTMLNMNEQMREQLRQLDREPLIDIILDLRDDLEP